MKSDWSPALYAKFGEERSRPLIDLIQRLPILEPRTIYDLGCGNGASTAPLRARFPEASITGIDTSPAMLATARATVPDVAFVEADIASFEPPVSADLLFANAALQWVPDHRRLLPRLAGLLAPGGVLATQMPDNLDEPSHRLMVDIARGKPYEAAINAARGQRAQLLGSGEVYDILVSAGLRVELWRTTYVHPLDGVQAIVEMMRSTGLRPYLDALTGDDRASYLAAYTSALAGAYPTRTDGKVLYPFPRVFLVAVRG